MNTYMISLTPKLLVSDPDVRKTFAIMFIAQMTMDDTLKVMCSDKAHFYSQ